MRSVLALLVVAFVGYAAATVYFKEEFPSNWESRWTKSTHKEKEGSQGKWAWNAGEFHNDFDADKGIQTSEDSRFYGIAAHFPKFSNKGKDLVLHTKSSSPRRSTVVVATSSSAPVPSPARASTVRPPTTSCLALTSAAPLLARST